MYSREALGVRIYVLHLFTRSPLHPPLAGSPVRRMVLTPLPSRRCAARRNKYFRTSYRFSALQKAQLPSNGLCSHIYHRPVRARKARSAPRNYPPPDPPRIVRARGPRDASFADENALFERYQRSEKALVEAVLRSETRMNWFGGPQKLRAPNGIREPVRASRHCQYRDAILRNWFQP